MRKLLITLCLLSSFISQAQVIVHFTPTGAGNMDGSSWANAKPGSQLAPTMRFYLSYVELWVAAGTYTTNTTVRDSSFAINNTLRVYGGFNGTETDINQRDIQANPTILSGDIGIPGDASDNNYHVVSFYNADSTTVLDGFIIQDGNADSSTGNWDNMGGGIRVWAGGNINTDYSKPTVRNCIIRNNNADYGGGGVEVHSIGVYTSIHLDNCIIEDNTSGSETGAKGGAGMVVFTFAGDGAVAADAEHCIFRNNTSQAGAGAVGIAAEFDNSATVSLRNCIFENNTALSASSIGINSSDDPYNANSHTARVRTFIDSCRFTHNTSTNSGLSSVIGAQYNKLGAPEGHEMRITNCTIDSNTSWSAPISIMGFSSMTSNVIEHCSIYHNVTQSVGGFYINSQNGHIDSTYVNNCLFYYTGKQGIYASGARNGSFVRSFINNSTFYNDSSRFGSESLITNTAVNDPGQSTDPCTANMYISNSIIWHFRPGYLLSGVFALKNFGYGSNATANIVTKNSVLNMDNNTWPNPIPGWGLPEYGTNGGGNVGWYPRFRDTAHFDFRLACGSPAIDAGNNSLIPTTVAHDLDGHNRILHTAVDMGCYEVDTLPAPDALPSVTVNNADITCTAGYNMQPDSVLWTFGDGQTSNTESATHTYTANGTYEVCLRIYTPCGEDVQCDTVTITAASVSHAGSPLDALSVYPNPATNELHVSGISSNVYVRLSSLTGSLLKEATLTPGKATLNISALPSGIYLLDVSSPSEGHRMVKVIKE